MERLPLFVFGTLRLGECNHHYLAGRYDRRVAAVLRDFVRTAPLRIDHAPGESVDGELYFLQLERYDETMRGCDDLEEIPIGSVIGDRRATHSAARGPVFRPRCGSEGGGCAS